MLQSPQNTIFDLAVEAIVRFDHIALNTTQTMPQCINHPFCSLCKDISDVAAKLQIQAQDTQL